MISNQPGVGPEPLEGQGTVAASLVPLVSETFQTPLLDLTQVASNIELVPSKLGYAPYIPLALCVVWLIEKVSGVQVTPVQIRAGNNAAHNNLLTNTTTPSNADVAAAQVPCIEVMNSTFIAPQSTMFESLPVFLDITAPAAGTGNFILQARLVVTVAWCSLSGGAT